MPKPLLLKKEEALLSRRKCVDGVTKNKTKQNKTKQNKNTHTHTHK
jgi:hypothetical protein